MKKYTYILLLNLVVLISACTKEVMGPDGIAGNKGKDASIILNGTIAPTASQGNIGDFYLDLATSQIYGPKTDKGWGTAISLKGDKGATGIKGPDGDPGKTGKNTAQFLSGKGAPTVGIGNIGDFYLDTDNYAIYGAKSNNGWGTSISLKGNKKNGANVFILTNIKLDVDRVSPNYMYSSPNAELSYTLNNQIVIDNMKNKSVLIYFKFTSQDDDKWELLQNNNNRFLFNVDEKGTYSTYSYTFHYNQIFNIGMVIRFENNRDRTILANDFSNTTFFTPFETKTNIDLKYVILDL